LKCGANQISALDISCNTQLGKGNPYVELFCALDFCDMPTLTNVCVWETFHQESIPIFTTGSDNFQFSYSCGTCSSIGTNDDYLSGLSIFPIPCHDILNIETGISDLYKIEVSSLNGQLIFVRIVEGPTHQLDLSSFQNGVYFITINLKDFVTTRKIIKL